MLIRYDEYEKDAALDIKIIRADEEGEPISPPLLQITDLASGERFSLDREAAWKLRDFINRM